MYMNERYPVAGRASPAARPLFDPDDTRMKG